MASGSRRQREVSGKVLNHQGLEEMYQRCSSIEHGEKYRQWAETNSQKRSWVPKVLAALHVRDSKGRSTNDVV